MKTLDPKKIEHLPILEKEDRGPIGYFDKRPVEIGEICLEETFGQFFGSGIPQERIPSRRMTCYVLGRSTKGELVTSTFVDNETGIVKRGEVIMGIIGYKTISKYDDKKG